jgi:ubiquinone/menaquinone biosynthesis C-methylase UbiE
VWTTGDELLLAYHECNPGATARAFADGRLSDGRSSYDLLASAVNPNEDVLDLGCGDGHLLELLVARGHDPDRTAGLDMSEAELALARKRRDLAGARLLCERAQATTLPDAALDCVVSHLALMLMSDIESVVAELARILRPRGRLVAIVGAGAAESDAYGLFRERFRLAYQRCGARSPAIGDHRTRDPAGLASLFHASAGFESIEVSTHVVRLDGTADRVWGTLAGMYQMMTMTEAAIAELRSSFLAAASPLADLAGRVPCTMRLLLAVARRRS